MRKDYRFVCLTDDPSGIKEDAELKIECYPLPDIELGSAPIWSGWRKLSSLSPKLAEDLELSGSVLFFDVDVIITGPLDDLVDFAPGHFCIIENWTQLGRGIGNSSVYRFEVGKHGNIFDDFEKRHEEIYNTISNEQMYLTKMVAEDHAVQWWPASWCQSFKVHALPHRLLRPFIPAKLPQDCRVLAFHGPPKPLDAAKGIWAKGAGGKRGRWIRPAPWIKDYWIV